MSRQPLGKPQRRDKLGKGPPPNIPGLGLGEEPVLQPQPDGDTNVCRCHMTVTQRAVTTQVAVSDALIFSWCPHSVGGPGLQAL